MKTLLTRGFAVSIATLLMAGSAIAAGAAPAPAAPGPDRSQLSLEENVAINAACFPVRKQGESAYEKCVNAQLAALKEHPSPDRSALSPQRNQQIEYACASYRSRGIAAYNDCLTQQITGTVAATPTADDSGKDPDLVAALKEIADDKPTATPVAMTTIGTPAAALPGWSGHTEDHALSASDFFKKVSRSIYAIVAAPTQADFRSGSIAQGSAVAVTDHLLLTNCHVVADRPFIRVIFDRIPVEATLVGADNAGDRCVLKVEKTTLTPVAGIRSFDDLAEGERVFAIGTPGGFQHTLSEGLISSLRRLSGFKMVQTTAPISPGSSGGGLFDERGNLIGITTLASIGRFQNINFAIAASDFWH